MILLVDNYDSFVHNLARYVKRLGQETVVARNDAITVAEIRSLAPAAIILSPGPCTPKQAGRSTEIVQQLSSQIPILGVCLGHQVIAEAFGGQTVRAKTPMHGRTSVVEHDGQGVFKGIPNPFTACRYHSLVVDRPSLPRCCEVSAWTKEGTIMALRHRHDCCLGVQFHPEAALSECGYLLLRNFLELAGLPLAHTPLAGSEVVPAPRRVSEQPIRPVTF